MPSHLVARTFPVAECLRIWLHAPSVGTPLADVAKSLGLGGPRIWTADKASRRAALDIRKRSPYGIVSDYFPRNSEFIAFAPPRFMNLILFEKPFETLRLESGDPRVAHIRKVLRAEIGTKVFVGFANGPRARAEVTMLPDDGSIELQVIATEPAPAPLPIQLLIGLPRPHTAKRILFEAASMGVQALHFCEVERGEPSYAQSSLWTGDEWKERLRLGAEQSFGTHIPEVTIAPDLQTAISQLPVDAPRIALDNYEAAAPLGQSIPADAASALLALGPERGWSPGERDTFRKNGWTLAHLGPQVLRTETACTAAVATVASRLGCWSAPTQTRI